MFSSFVLSIHFCGIFCDDEMEFFLMLMHHSFFLSNFIQGTMIYGSEKLCFVEKKETQLIMEYINSKY